ncbi:MAG: hypothetical protein AAGI66_09870, partial [Cyanobacteria bacterium P01_H01_bin.74]
KKRHYLLLFVLFFFSIFFFSFIIWTESNAMLLLPLTLMFLLTVYNGINSYAKQVLALGSYRHDVAYTAALKSVSKKPTALPMGTYRHDVAYTAALKSVSPQGLALGTYRHDVAYTAALKSIQTLFNPMIQKITGVDHAGSIPVIFCFSPPYSFCQARPAEVGGL